MDCLFPACRHRRYHALISKFVRFQYWLLVIASACFDPSVAWATTSKAKNNAVSAKVGARPSYAQHPVAQIFIREMVEKHHFIESELQQLFSQVLYVPAAARLMTPSSSSKAKIWSAYRARFIEPLRIQGGVAFWQEHSEWLARAEKEYGVPASIIVAIIGVETMYGRNSGKFRVLDALATLAFDYPSGPNIKSRAPFFRQQLEEFLLLANTADWDVYTLRGSYAGAIGIPQFMPSSYRRFGVDFDGDGKTDLRNSAADAIGSVAHFLQKHGWISNQALYYPLPSALDLQQMVSLAQLAERGIEPNLRSTDLVAAGIAIENLNPALNYAVIDLPQGENGIPEYVLGTQNFFVITRYNRSSFYALCVIELAAAIEKARGNIQN